jgi:3-methyladenine DNA glycosylase/8-oxoguanine DNA glycosylase
LEITVLKNCLVIDLEPKAPYNFNANFNKPSHFPSSNAHWEEDSFWTSTVWKRQELGLKFEDKGTIDKPKVTFSVFSQELLSKEFIDSLIPEIRWRFNFDSDLTEFSDKFEHERVLGPLIVKWRGMKPVAGVSLYEMLIIFVLLQNATVRRTVQMLENLFVRFGKKVAFDEKEFSTYWEPRTMAKSSVQELRELKLGYRAKFLMKIAEHFVNNELDELALRSMKRDEVKKELLNLYGIGPVSVNYLLCEGFYFCDTLESIPPFEQKIMSRVIFNRNLVSAKRILKFFRENYREWEMLAFHYFWEDLFWRRKKERIEWLEKEIRL